MTTAGPPVPVAGSAESCAPDPLPHMAAGRHRGPAARPGGTCRTALQCGRAGNPAREVHRVVRRAAIGRRWDDVEAAAVGTSRRRPGEGAAEARELPSRVRAASFPAVDRGGNQCRSDGVVVVMVIPLSGERAHL
jgi:hypothetical protein